MAIVEFHDVSKEYHMGPVVVAALNNVSLAFDSGDFVAITGPSGSGKSTLLNLLGLLDQPTSGKYLLDGIEVGALSDDQRSEIRSRRISFIFQSYNLIPQLSVIENIEVPLYYQGWLAHKSHQRASELAELVGLADRIHHRPTELSGGQQQRVAVARALASDPLVILADEPTGNLDSATGEEILRLIISLNDQGKTIVMVTHDERVADHAGRRVEMLDGRVDRST
jgi:putative ABC transport system ATP-binding protein